MDAAPPTGSGPVPPTGDGPEPPTGALVLAEDEWRERQRRHRERVEAWVQPRLSRRAEGRRHPVDDFLFDYYPHRPGQLRRWHPGHGVVLAGAAQPWLQMPAYQRTALGVTTSVQALAARSPRLARAATLLRATRSRPARFGCFARHEWAMVYRLDPGRVRHASYPLRVSDAVVAQVVESSPLHCTHLDAYRFFTPEAVPLNERPLTRAGQVDDEQGGCLHATMDLYRWAFTASPFVDSDLVADCFALARIARDLDMRASPYDLVDLGYEPLPIETEEGRARFAREQRDLAAAGDVLRRRLLARLDALLAVVDARPGTMDP